MVAAKSLCCVVMLFCCSASVLCSDGLFAQGENLTAGEVIARHRDSIGKPEELAKIASRGISGKAAVQFIQGATGLLNDGRFLCVSEGRKIEMVMKFGANRYPGEYFAYNGSESSVGHISPGQRSPLADILFRYDAVMKMGFLGGVLSVAWPLLKPLEEQPGMLYRHEEIEGQPVHTIEYLSDKSLGDVRVKLFFDIRTFRHVRSEYRVRLKNDMTAMDSVVSGLPRSARDSARRPADLSPRPTIQESQPDSIYVLIEKFSNLAKVGEEVLPQDYLIEYSVEGYGASFVARWAVLIEHWRNNGVVDESFFTAQK